MGTAPKTPGKAMYVAAQSDEDWLRSEQRKLYERSKEQLEYVFDKLWGLVTDTRNLQLAVARVSRNRGARTAGVDGLTVRKILANGAERSRRPHTSPTKVPLELEDFIVSARKQHPTWGPKKLRAWILHHHPQRQLPAPSTVGDILRRRGMTQGQLRKPRSKETARQPFANVTGPNATWCADFKGHFATGDGRRCYPLTIIDAHSRFLIRCGQRATVCVRGRGRADEAVGLVDTTRHPSRANRARQAAGERTT
jgi:transposase InsO family protein